MIQISAIAEDQLIVRASYGPSVRDKTHDHRLRGRIVHRTHLMHATMQHTYRYVQFEDTGCYAWVRDDNIAHSKRPN